MTILTLSLLIVVAVLIGILAGLLIAFSGNDIEEL